MKIDYWDYCSKGQFLIQHDHLYTKIDTVCTKWLLVNACNNTVKHYLTIDSLGRVHCVKLKASRPKNSAQKAVQNHTVVDSRRQYSFFSDMGNLIISHAGFPIMLTRFPLLPVPAFSPGVSQLSCAEPLYATACSCSSWQNCWPQWGWEDIKWTLQKGHRTLRWVYLIHSGKTCFIFETDTCFVRLVLKKVQKEQCAAIFWVGEFLHAVMQHVAFCHKKFTFTTWTFPKMI